MEKHATDVVTSTQHVVSSLSQASGTTTNVEDATVMARDPRLIEEGYRNGKGSESDLRLSRRGCNAEVHPPFRAPFKSSPKFLRHLSS